MMAALARDGAPTLRNLHKWSLKLGASPFQADTEPGTEAVEEGDFWVESCLSPYSHFILPQRWVRCSSIEEFLTIGRNQIQDSESDFS